MSEHLGPSTQELTELLSQITQGPWAYIATGEKSNEWGLGTWQYEDGTDVPAGAEVGDCDTERYFAAGTPDGWGDYATVIDRVCENPSSSANLADAQLIALAPTIAQALIEAREALRTLYDLAEHHVSSVSSSTILRVAGAEITKEAR